MRRLGDRDLDKLIKINRWIENVNKVDDIVIIVEGKTDKAALEKLGVQHEILLFYRENFWRRMNSLTHFKEKLIILTDFDNEGNNLNKKIMKYAIDNNIEVLENERINFRKVTKGLGNEIYGIVKGIMRIKEKYI